MFWDYACLYVFSSGLLPHLLYSYIVLIFINQITFILHIITLSVIFPWIFYYCWKCFCIHLWWFYSSWVLNFASRAHVGCCLFGVLFCTKWMSAVCLSFLGLSLHKSSIWWDLIVHLPNRVKSLFMSSLDKNTFPLLFFGIVWTCLSKLPYLSLQVILVFLILCIRDCRLLWSSYFFLPI